jgi:hypothetical protein
VGLCRAPLHHGSRDRAAADGTATFFEAHREAVVERAIDPDTWGTPVSSRAAEPFLDIDHDGYGSIRSPGCRAA